ncbi:calcyphosin-2-like [Lineus longissimus]|uniref:calcyphosin-2-like n=1 Tax=Lineus longissimus TaxID=88925 RepID=UPI002B4FA679
MSLGVVGTSTPRASQRNLPGNGRGSRPTSARPQSRIDPITGREMTYGNQGHPRPGSRPGSRPQEVPALDLKAFADQNEKSGLQGQISYRLQDTARSGSTAVSWGTPASTARREAYQDYIPQGKPASNRPGSRPSSRPAGVPGLHLQGENQVAAKKSPKQPSAWDKDPVPANTPGPDAKHKEKYQQYEKEMKESYRNKGKTDVAEDEVARKIAEYRKKHGPADITDGEFLEQMKEMTGQAYRPETSMKKMDVEELEDEKRKHHLVETVMVDQLSRLPMTDPDDDQSAAISRRYVTGTRGTNRFLHESKIKTSGIATENLLSRRVRFGARVLSRNGHDAIRELMGFFFTVDNSLTLYEYRQFGKSAKALPFIGRGTHYRIAGRRRGEPYTLRDLYPGNVLVFSTEGHNSLPATIKAQPTVCFKVTEVDEEAKNVILLKTMKGYDRDEAILQLQLPESKEELNDFMLLRKLQALVQEKLKKRGVRTVTGLGSYFRSLDETGDGVLNKYELEQALVKYHINLSDEEFEDVWDVIDINCDSCVDYGEFMRGIIGCMSEYRKSFVLKAYRKIDANKKGLVTESDIRKFYNARKHPAVISGESTEVELLKQFLASFSFTQKKGEITFVEFEEYYEGLSLGIHSDEDFINVLKNTWGL